MILHSPSSSFIFLHRFELSCIVLLSSSATTTMISSAYCGRQRMQGMLNPLTRKLHTLFFSPCEDKDESQIVYQQGGIPDFNPAEHCFEA
jgi:hypothetical protein